MSPPSQGLSPRSPTRQSRYGDGALRRTSRPEGAGLYVHLPYCASRCEYCSFVVTTDASSRDVYFRALLREADLLEPEARYSSFDSLYLGGGTPSLASPQQIASLLLGLRERFSVGREAEVTLEANPEDVTPERADAWALAGVNRVSVGVQSLEDRELSAVGRRHDAARAAAALETLLEKGFSVSGDLILGLPEQTAQSFRRSAAGLAGAGVEHVSVYLLETEKSKAIEEDRHLRPERYLGDDAQADLWLELNRTLADRGLHHYEISNWARAGREARHNLKYWTRTPTLGLGVSAHEFWSGRRRANVSTIPGYIEALEAGERPVALDWIVDAPEAARERIVLGLRLAEGVAAAEIESWVAESGDRLLEGDYRLWISEGMLARRGDRVHFTERGFLICNEILCRFV